MLDWIALVSLPIALTAYLMPTQWSFVAGASICTVVMLGVAARYAAWLVSLVLYALRRMPVSVLRARRNLVGWAGLGLGVVLAGQMFLEYPALSDIQDPLAWGWFITGTGAEMTVWFAFARGALCTPRKLIGSVLE